MRSTGRQATESVIDGRSDLLANTDERFAVADATWRELVVQAFGRAPVGEPVSTEARGAPGSLLREAYEARERAYLRWRTVRGLGKPGT